ncbi:hypothetical protein ACIOUE_16480 [Streptomyces xanthochromogenes]|uniref:hypothetical protein n=1 Tax=Streptomyces xanthochromogenes TaxID=67384 RepID=UPI00380CCC13
MARLRIQRTNWPRPALVLTDTPDPDCPDCLGDGWFEEDYGDHEAEYAGTDCWPCTCWEETRRWLILPLPRPRPTGPGRDPWSSEPPF